MNDFEEHKIKMKDKFDDINKLHSEGEVVDLRRRYKDIWFNWVWRDEDGYLYFSQPRFRHPHDISIENVRCTSNWPKKKLTRVQQVENIISNCLEPKHYNYLDMLPDDIQQHINSMAKKMEQHDLSKVFRVGMFSTTKDGDLLYISKRTKCYVHISRWVGTGVEWLGKYKIRSGPSEYITQMSRGIQLYASELNFKYA